MARPKKKRKNGERLHREPIVREVARLLETGIPTKWRWTSEARHGLRAAMCTKGMAWATADTRAEEIVTLARHRIGLSLYPSWSEARGETPREREFWFCAACGGFMKAHGRPWCSEECRYIVHGLQRVEGRRRDDEARHRALRIIFTGGAEQPKAPRARRCRRCDKLFAIKHTRMNQKYCSHHCFAQAERRLVARDCLICATSFRPAGPALYCSPACIAEVARRRHREARARARLWHTHDCAICGTAFTTSKKHQVHCSAECTTEAHRRAVRTRRARRRDAAEVVAPA